ncbi:MAG TPA: phospholipid carrier-dependent glycosyltransferase, partial [Acidobacteriaceae bacterium]|nr:phospholipid carrier-dependent glycosyltransferase [Acidobacteriaceae bacterium]
SHARALPSLYRWAVLTLLLVMAGEIFLSTRQLSQTFDESDHLYSGYEYWKHADFGHNPEHPPLAKLVAGLALLPLHPQDPPAIPGMSFKGQDFRGAQKFLYTGDADRLLARGRAMMLLFTLSLGLILFSAGREMFAAEPGLLALALFAFEPMLLAHGGLVTTDMALSCTLFASVYAFYRYAARPSAARLLLCAIAVGLTLAAKQSGVFVFPILAVLALADLLLKLRYAAPGSSPRGLIRSVGLSFALAFAVIIPVSLAVLWAFYGFRYAARPAGLAMVPTLDQYAAAIPSHVESSAILFCARHHLLPESYLFGWADILLLPGNRITFLLGKLYLGRRLFLFPALILIKTTLGLLALLALVPFARLWRRSREFLYLAAPAAIYLLIAVASGMNAEARYILPIYPFGILLAAAAACELAHRSRAWTIAVAALVLFAAVSSLHAFPNYLPYANEAFGGPSKSYRQMSNSNGDWAQGLKLTKKYLDQNHISDCWIDYSDPAIDPAYYGIPCKPMPSGLGHAVGFPTPIVPETITGTIVLSANELAGPRWGPGELNPYDQFKHLRPDAIPGDVMLVYHGAFHVPLASAYSQMSAAIVLLRSGKVPQGVAQAQAAARLAPGSAEIQAILGQILNATGKTAEAQQVNARALHLAQTIYPEFQQPLIHRLQGSGMAYRP